MAETERKRSPPRLPPGYVSLAQLQERWLQKELKEKEEAQRQQEMQQKRAQSPADEQRQKDHRRSDSARIGPGERPRRGRRRENDRRMHDPAGDTAREGRTGDRTRRRKKKLGPRRDSRIEEYPSGKRGLGGKFEGKEGENSGILLNSFKDEGCPSAEVTLSGKFGGKDGGNIKFQQNHGGRSKFLENSCKNKGYPSAEVALCGKIEVKDGGNSKFQENSCKNEGYPSAEVALSGKIERKEGGNSKVLENSCKNEGYPSPEAALGGKFGGEDGGNSKFQQNSCKGGFEEYLSAELALGKKPGGEEGEDFKHGENSWEAGVEGIVGVCTVEVVEKDEEGSASPVVVSRRKDDGRKGFRRRFRGNGENRRVINSRVREDAGNSMGSGNGIWRLGEENEVKEEVMMNRSEQNVGIRRKKGGFRGDRESERAPEQRSGGIERNFKDLSLSGEKDGIVRSRGRLCGDHLGMRNCGRVGPGKTLRQQGTGLVWVKKGEVSDFN